MKNFYAVRQGYITGIFTQVEDFHKAVKGYVGSEGKGFKTEDEAIFYLYGKEGIINKYLHEINKVENKEKPSQTFDKTLFKSKAEEYVNTLIHIFKDIKESYEFNVENINDFDKELQDLLHEIELSNFSEARGLELAKELQNIRSERRTLKDDNETLCFLYDYFKTFENLLTDLYNIRGKIDKKQKELKNRVYFAKIRKDLTIPNKPIVNIDIKSVC